MDGHALVIGAGLGGLFTARALADTYAAVTVLDRDELPDTPAARKGVPQGRHAHALLARGLEAIAELFPGIEGELAALGVSSGDAQADLHFYNNGHRLSPARSGLTAVAASRPLLEHIVRTRVAAHPRIQISGGQTAHGLLSTMAKDRVTGVRARATNGMESVIEADLVVDAGGRGGQSARWLAELDCPPAPEQTVQVGMTYVTRRYRYDEKLLDGRLGLIVASYPGQVYGGAVGREDGDRIVLGLQAMLGTELPTDSDAMAAVADRLDDALLARVIREGEPIGDAVRMRYPASVRRRYERLRWFPHGYLVTGDALCHFNPIYAQGMTVAALEALLLRDLLRHGVDDMARRFFRGTAKLVDSPWSIATGSDLRFADIEGHRPPTARLVNAYLDRYHAAAAADPVLGTAFLRVANLIDSPARLFSPRLVVRVARAARLRPAAPTKKATT